MSRGYNLSSDDAFGILTGPGDLIRTDPMLGPLQNNGGRTLTHALLPDSPAIDAGDPNFTPPPFFDQRGAGHPRVVNRRVDKGSFGGTKRKHAHTDGYGDSNSERHSHSYGYVYAYINTSVTDTNRYVHSDAYAYG
jgi:hypothetical protein